MEIHYDILVNISGRKDNSRRASFNIGSKVLSFMHPSYDTITYANNLALECHNLHLNISDLTTKTTVLCQLTVLLKVTLVIYMPQRIALDQDNKVG